MNFPASYAQEEKLEKLLQRRRVAWNSFACLARLPSVELASVES